MKLKTKVFDELIKEQIEANPSQQIINPYTNIALQKTPNKIKKPVNNGINKIH